MDLCRRWCLNYRNDEWINTKDVKIIQLDDGLSENKFSENKYVKLGAKVDPGSQHWKSSYDSDKLDFCFFVKKFIENSFAKKFTQPQRDL